MGLEGRRPNRPPAPACPCSRVSPNRRAPRRRRGAGTSERRRPRRRARATSSSPPRRFLAACLCSYLLSAAGSAGVSGDGDGTGTGRTGGFLRSVAAEAAEPPSPSTFAEVQQEEEEEEEEEEEFDYEAYHARHGIPVPALGATMMGLANAAGAAAERDDSVSEEDAVPRSGILAFAGTSQAMMNFASKSDGGWEGGRGSDEPGEAEDETPPPPYGGANAMMYETTLAQISSSRTSLLWGSDPVAEEDSEEEKSKSESDAGIFMGGGSQVGGREPTYSSSFQVPLSSPETMRSTLHRTDSDLDRGRHLVGLEVREVRAHEQIVVDYADASSEGGGFGEPSAMSPLRIKYILADNEMDSAKDGADDERRNNAQLLSMLLETSFNRTADFLSRALALQPVQGNIVPAIGACGGATIPTSHRAAGVQNADVLIYVSGDNRFCGGAAMHAAICDFDQHMRPLVGNINICTENIPTETLGDGGTRIPLTVITDYDAYVAAETVRLLGASASLFRHYRNPDTNAAYGSTEKQVSCVDGTSETIAVPNMIGEVVDPDNGKVHYEIRTPKVIEVVRNHFDCMTLTGARLEARSRGVLGCFGGFLDERLFFGEQVTGFQLSSAQNGNEGLAITPLTLALLEDTSWYSSNYTLSTKISFGHGAGCQFAHAGGCSAEADSLTKVTTQSEGFHCEDIGKTGCDASHAFKAKCDSFRPVSSTIPSAHDLFAGSSSSRDDICPMHIRAAVSCADEGAAEVIPGEVYGKSSKCFVTDRGEPLCLVGTCNKKTQSIDVRFEDEVFSCDHDGQIIDTNNGLRILCPRIAAVCPNLVCPSSCSGRGVCDEDREGKHICICDDPFDDSPGCWGQ
ncbi:hypothetical protein ACHAWF_012920 [Thalassiosira exigua]